MSQLAIVGNGSEGEPAIITCQPLTGLAFFWSTNITMCNLSLIGCGKLLNSDNKFANKFSSLYSVAILFFGCNSIELNNLHVSESNGTGVVINNPIGKVFIDRCSFTYNGLHRSGGGGLVIEASEATSQSFCTITNSTFTHNIATVLEKETTPVTQWINLCNIGKGGGIAVVLRGEATNNIVQINSVHLNSNKAQFGGGLFIAFYDNVSNNTVTVDYAKVTENEVLLGSIPSGGGVFIGFAAIGMNFPLDNVVAIKSSIFSSNEADVGGGISVDLVHDAHRCPSNGNTLLIENCMFDNNTAFQGSSAYLSQSGMHTQPLLNTTVSNSNFTIGHCGTVLRNVLGLHCFGNFLVESMSLVIFQGAIRFIGVQNVQNSYISALTLRSSSIKLLSTTRLQFINNSALNGAGIFLVGSSSIIVNNGSAILFKHNTVLEQGAAIYADTCTLGQTRFCFVQHSNPVLRPDDWGVNVTFIDNKLISSQPNAIYVDSIQSNIWPDSFNRTFCWKGWFYQFDCSTELRSGPAYVTCNLGPLNYNTVTIYPGHSIENIIQLTVYDIWANDILKDANKILLEAINGPAYVDDMPNTISSPIKVDCSTDYTNQTSLMFIHPFQFPVIPITVQFERCDLPQCSFLRQCHVGMFSIFLPIIW